MSSKQQGSKAQQGPGMPQPPAPAAAAAAPPAAAAPSAPQTAPAAAAQQPAAAAPPAQAGLPAGLSLQEQVKRMLLAKKAAVGGAPAAPAAPAPAAAAAPPAAPAAPALPVAAAAAAPKPSKPAVVKKPAPPAAAAAVAIKPDLGAPQHAGEQHIAAAAAAAAVKPAAVAQSAAAAAPRSASAAPAALTVARAALSGLAASSSSSSSAASSSSSSAASSSSSAPPAAPPVDETKDKLFVTGVSYRAVPPRPPSPPAVPSVPPVVLPIPLPATADLAVSALALELHAFVVGSKKKKGDGLGGKGEDDGFAARREEDDYVFEGGLGSASNGGVGGEGKSLTTPGVRSVFGAVATSSRFPAHPVDRHRALGGVPGRPSKPKAASSSSGAGLPKLDAASLGLIPDFDGFDTGEGDQGGYDGSGGVGSGASGSGDASKGGKPDGAASELQGLQLRAHMTPGLILSPDGKAVVYVTAAPAGIPAAALQPHHYRRIVVGLVQAGGDVEVLRDAVVHVGTATLELTGPPLPDLAAAVVAAMEAGGPKETPPVAVAVAGAEAAEGAPKGPIATLLGDWSFLPPAVIAQLEAAPEPFVPPEQQAQPLAAVPAGQGMTDDGAQPPSAGATLPKPDPLLVPLADSRTYTLQVYYLPPDGTPIAVGGDDQPPVDYFQRGIPRLTRRGLEAWAARGYGRRRPASDTPAGAVADCGDCATSAAGSPTTAVAASQIALATSEAALAAAGSATGAAGVVAAAAAPGPQVLPASTSAAAGELYMARRLKVISSEVVTLHRSSSAADTMTTLLGRFVDAAENSNAVPTLSVPPSEAGAAASVSGPSAHLVRLQSLASTTSSATEDGLSSALSPVNEPRVRGDAAALDAWARTELTAESALLLKTWFARHWADPEPKAADIAALAAATGLEHDVIGRWFLNERRRYQPEAARAALAHVTAVRAHMEAQRTARAEAYEQYRAAHRAYCARVVEVVLRKHATGDSAGDAAPTTSAAAPGYDGASGMGMDDSHLYTADGTGGGGLDAAAMGLDGSAMDDGYAAAVAAAADAAVSGGVAVLHSNAGRSGTGERPRKRPRRVPMWNAIRTELGPPPMPPADDTVVPPPTRPPLPLPKRQRRVLVARPEYEGGLGPDLVLFIAGVPVRLPDWTIFTATGQLLVPQAAVPTGTQPLGPLVSVSSEVVRTADQVKPEHLRRAAVRRLRKLRRVIREGMRQGVTEGGAGGAGAGGEMVDDPTTGGAAAAAGSGGSSSSRLPYVDVTDTVPASLPGRNRLTAPASPSASFHLPPAPASPAAVVGGLNTTAASAAAQRLAEEPLSLGGMTVEPVPALTAPAPSSSSSSSSGGQGLPRSRAPSFAVAAPGFGAMGAAAATSSGLPPAAHPTSGRTSPRDRGMSDASAPDSRAGSVGRSGGPPSSSRPPVPRGPAVSADALAEESGGVVSVPHARVAAMVRTLSDPTKTTLPPHVTFLNADGSVPDGAAFVLLPATGCLLVARVFRGEAPSATSSSSSAPASSLSASSQVWLLPVAYIRDDGGMDGGHGILLPSLHLPSDETPLGSSGHHGGPGHHHHHHHGLSSGGGLEAAGHGLLPGSGTSLGREAGHGSSGHHPTPIPFNRERLNTHRGPDHPRSLSTFAEAANGHGSGANGGQHHHAALLNALPGVDSVGIVGGLGPGPEAAAPGSAASAHHTGAARTNRLHSFDGGSPLQWNH